VGKVPFYGYASGAFGFYIEPDGFKGWDGGVDIRDEDEEIPQRPGSFDLPVFPKRRLPVIQGFCRAESPERIGWYGRQLTGLAADGGRVRITVEKGGVRRWADARLVGSSDFDQIRNTRFARYQLQLRCANPRKFGETRRFASGVPAFHRGNFRASPVITVTPTGSGMPNGYSINGPSGRKYTVSAGLATGHVHVIDMATGLIAVDGVVTAGIVTQPDTWSILPAQQVAMTLVPVSGSGVLSAAVVDTDV